MATLTNKKPAFRSGFEATVAKKLSSKRISYKYESTTIAYVSKHTYTPDFVLPNGIILETKGYFRPEARRLMLEVINQNPTLDIRMVFQNPKVKLNKTSKLTYADWCDRHKIRWGTIDDIPAWSKE